MDPECIPICEAINRIPGLETLESCCGHKEKLFRVWFQVDGQESLPVLLYYVVPCHMGFRWPCKVKTDCAMSPVVFYIESEEVGDKAYRQANKIADEVNAFMDENPDGLQNIQI